jgi:uncharacterized protein (DUF4415 family)
MLLQSARCREKLPLTSRIPFMAEPPRRRTGDPREAAEAAFRKATAPPPPPTARKLGLPGVKESVTLRIDREVLDFFQKDGPGWQDRIIEALRGAAGVGGTGAAIPVDKLNASNDE